MTTIGEDYTSVQSAMIKFYAKGFNVLPVKSDKTKAPDVSDWKQYENEPQVRADIERFIAQKPRGLGVVCGQGSENLEMLEFEGRAVAEGVYTKFTAAISNYGLDKLWARVAGGYMEFSPSGGMHFLYRVSDREVPGNTVFARRAETDTEMTARGWTEAEKKRGAQTRRAKTWIETRGQGGYVVVAPTEKICHELDKPYVLACGGPESVVTVTWAEREKLADVAAELSTWEPQAADWGSDGEYRAKNSGGPAGLAYAAEYTWQDILHEEGWTETRGRDGDDGWLHPDATSKLSALSNDNTLTVFSSSTVFGTSNAPRNPFVSVSKFEAYAVFNHDGDFAAAEIALREAGWGDYSAVQRGDQMAAYNGDEGAQQRLANARKGEQNVPAPDAVQAAQPYVPAPPAQTAAEVVTAHGGLVLPPPSAPLAVADFIFSRYRYAGMPTLMRHDQSWLKWNGVHWDTFEDEEMERTVYDLTRDAVYHKAKPDGTTEEHHWVPNSTRVTQVIHALRSVALVRSSVARGTWLSGSGPVVIPCANGLLNVRTRELIPPTPAYFGLAHVSAAWTHDAKAPWWEWFMSSLWSHDPDSVRLLRQWFGYLISGRTDLQKILLVTGPKRSGKGTISRVMEALSAGAFSGPTLGSLGQHFGLEPLLGKSLAVVSDMRLSPKDDRHLMTERLLAISGEDTIDIERKHKGGAVTGQLPLRFALMSNEVPQFPDAAGALASRFLLLTMKRSFYNQEDTTLKGKVLAELPGIINWALEGLADLEEHGQFIETASSSASREELREGSSEYLVYAEERLVPDPAAWVKIDDVYQDWRIWAEKRGGYTGDIRTFGRMLRAAVPELEVARRGPRGDQAKGYTGYRLKTTALMPPMGAGFNGYAPYNT